jgi:hypothetical protein
MWIVVAAFSVFCSKGIKYVRLEEEPMLSGEAPSENVRSLLETADKVVSSSFNMHNAEMFVKAAKRLISEDPLTKEQLTAVELATTIMLHQLKRSGVVIALGKKGELKETLKKLIKLVQAESIDAKNSGIGFAIDFESRVSILLKSSKLRESDFSMDGLLLQFRIYKKVLGYLYNREDQPGSEPSDEFMENGYMVGFTVISSLKTSFDFSAMENFLEFVYTLFISYNSPASQLVAVGSQCKTIFVNLKDREHMDRLAEELRHAHQYILGNVKDYYDIKKDMSVSLLVIMDTRGETSLYRYEESLKFLNSHPFRNQSLKIFLLNSIEYRRYLVNDSYGLILFQPYEQFKFLDQMKQRMYGFYYLTKFQTGEKRRAKLILIDLLKDAEISLEEAQATFMIAKENFNIEDIRTLLPAKLFKKYTAIAPKDKHAYLEKVLTSKQPMTILELIAVNVLTDFNHPLIQQLIEEFDRKAYTNFCRGADQLREFLKSKAKGVKKM